MKYIPNAFQVPNAFVDEMMADLSGSAIKCYLKIVRQTTGWNKEMDYIAISQFQDACGIKKRDTVSHALNELEQAGLIERVERFGSISGYRLKGVNPLSETVKPTPKNGVGTHPENGGTTKPNIKPTNTKPKYTGARDQAHAPEHAPADDAIAAQLEQPAKPKKRKPSPAALELEAFHLLADRGVDGVLARDYMALRTLHKAPLTETALVGIEREANKAGLSLVQALTLCCERGWRGFRAEWLQRDAEPARAASGQPRPNRINQIPQHTQGGAFLAKDVL